MPSSEPLEFRPDALFFRRIPKGTWSAREERPFKNQFELRPGESGLSVFDASRCRQSDVIGAFPGWGLTQWIFEELVEFGFAVFECEDDEGLPPALRNAHFEIRVRDLPVGSLSGRYQRSLSVLAARRMLRLPDEKAP